MKPDLPVRSAGRYEIRNATSEKEAELWIYEEISSFWGIDAGQFNRDLAKITAPTIKLRINSNGGNVHAGMAIFNALRRHPSRVVTHVDGIAASIASVIALAGDEVIMPSNTFLMIHNAHAGAVGDAKVFREFADILDKHTEQIRTIYTARTGREEDEVRAWMDAETWMTAAEAHERGFIDTVTDATLEAAACVDVSGFGYRNVPAELAARATDRVQLLTEAELEEMYVERRRTRELVAQIEKA